MMNSHPHAQLNWFEFLEVGFFVLLALLVLLQLTCLCLRTPPATSRTKSIIAFEQIRSWQNLPEIQLLMLAVPLQLLWEIAQFPLYTVWHEGDWSYILYGLIHCTLGDLLIMLCVFWLVSLLNQSRRWIFSPSFANFVLFTGFGLGYTIFSEIVNTRFKGTWGYTELMPIVPFVEIGGMPFLQWLLIPPVLIWLMRLINTGFRHSPE